MQQPLHVVHIIKVILVAGAERHLLTLLPALRVFNVTSSILLLVEPDKPMDDYMQMAAELDIPVERVVIKHHADPSLPLKMHRAIKKLQPDVIHTHLLHADLYGVLIARMMRIPVVTSRHNDNTFRRKLPMRLLHRILWGMSQHGIAISDAIREFCITIEAANPDKITTVHYGVDAEALHQNKITARVALRADLGLPEDTLIMGMMCRLIEQKGIIYGLQAFANIKDIHPNAHLVISGDGVLRNALETEATRLGLNGRTHFLGWRPEPTETLAGYDVLLMPSLWEGFGLVMLEAMAQGLPIIGSDVSAIPEIIQNGETGVLVQPRDVQGLTQALDMFMREPDNRTRMGQAAYHRLIQVFNITTMAQKTVNIYYKITVL